MQDPPSILDQARPSDVHLRLLATTDLHGYLTGYNYFTDAPSPGPSLEHLASVIETLRAEAPNALLFDNGDLLQGTPLTDFAAQALPSAEAPHPMITTLNLLGCDAASIGNHDFNYGLEFLAAALAGAAYPAVLSNVALRGKAPFQQKALLEREVVDQSGARHTLRLGVIGLVPPQIMDWDADHLTGQAEASDMVEAATRAIGQLRGEAADLVIALAHTGIGPEEHIPGMENAALPLAKLPGLDALVLGHTHMQFPAPKPDASKTDPQAGKLHGTPAVMAGCFGSHLGVIDLLLRKGAEGWAVAASHSALHRPAGTPSKAMQQASEPVHRATLNYIRRPVGRTSAPLHSYTALIAHGAAMQLVAEAQVWRAQTLLQGTEHADLPVLAATSPFKTGGRAGPDFFTDIPAGALAVKHIADLYLYPNTLAALRVTGAGLRAWLERSASLFHQIRPGAQDAALLGQSAPSYNFDVISGLDFRIDLSQPPRFDEAGQVLNPGARRVTGLSYQGRPLEDAQQAVVVTNSYRASRGGNFPGLDTMPVVLKTAEKVSDSIALYLTQIGDFKPKTARGTHFLPQAGTRPGTSPDTSVALDTGRGLRRHPEEIARLNLTDLGDTPEGFARFRLRL